MNSYDTIIVTTANDYLRTRSNLNRIITNIPSEKIIVIGNAEVGEMVLQEKNCNISFVNENDLLPFAEVEQVLADILHADSIPHGLTGWYYQQFLKMVYCYHSSSSFYMSWDGDTVPTKPFVMFDEKKNKPYFHMKYEFHEEYFKTLAVIFPQMKKAVNKSFISEHMLFNCEIMKRLIGKIEANSAVPGKRFYEKILRAISIEKIQSNSFSEFESYGTYVLYNYPESYILKDWHSIRYGSVYFHADELTDADYLWIGKDFDAISFEKNQDFNPDIHDLFFNPRYRDKLTCRQIIEAIQDNSEGMREEWE